VPISNLLSLIEIEFLIELMSKFLIVYCILCSFQIAGKHGVKEKIISRVEYYDYGQGSTTPHRRSGQELADFMRERKMKCSCVIEASKQLEEINLEVQAIWNSVADDARSVFFDYTLVIAIEYSDGSKDYIGLTDSSTLVINTFPASYQGELFNIIKRKLGRRCRRGLRSRLE
jgi:hypothetical protein